MKISSIKSLKTRVLNTPALREDLIKDPVGFVKRLEPLPVWSKGVFMAIVIIVGLSLIVSMVVSATIVLNPPVVGSNLSGEPILLQPEIDSFFVMIGSGSLGALAGALVPKPQE